MESKSSNLLEKSNQLFSYSELLTSIPLEKHLIGYPTIVASIATNETPNKIPHIKLKSSYVDKLKKKPPMLDKSSSVFDNTLVNTTFILQANGVDKSEKNAIEHYNTESPHMNNQKINTTYTFSSSNSSPVITTLGSNNLLINNSELLQIVNSDFIKDRVNHFLLSNISQ